MKALRESHVKSMVIAIEVDMEICIPNESWIKYLLTYALDFMINCF